MAVARPGQMLVDGRLHSMRDLQASTPLGEGVRLCLPLRVVGGRTDGVPPAAVPALVGPAAARVGRASLARAHRPFVWVPPRRAVQWRDDGGALLLSQAVGPLEFSQLGYLQVKVGGRAYGFVWWWCVCVCGDGGGLVEGLFLHFRPP